MFVLFLSSLPVFFIDGFFEQKISFTTCLENCHVIDGNIQVDAPGILIPPPTNLSTSTYRYGKPEGGKVSSTKRLESDENISASTSSTLGERGALETLYGRQDGENVPGLRPEVVNRLRKKFAEEKPGQKEKREASSTLQDVLDTKRETLPGQCRCRARGCFCLLTRLDCSPRRRQRLEKPESLGKQFMDQLYCCYVGKSRAWSESKEREVQSDGGRPSCRISGQLRKY